jgi:hypothetical protein
VYVHRFCGKVLSEQTARREGRFRLRAGSKTPQLTALAKHMRRQTSRGNVNCKKRRPRSAEATVRKRGPRLFRVDCVRQQRVVGGKVEYRVHWEGYGTEEDTWYCRRGRALSNRTSVSESSRSLQGTA